jgi:hypothetical protein
VWAEANTREAIFAAFQARRVFATTGPRPDLRFKVAGAFMGETVTADAAPSVELTVSCSTPIAAAEIARDGQTVFTQSCDSTAVAIAWKDAACRPGEHYYYAHIVFAGTAATLPWNRAPAVGVDAWSSPAWVRCC